MNRSKALTLMGMALAITACSTTPSVTAPTVGINGIVTQSAGTLMFNGKALLLDSATITKNGTATTKTDVQAGTIIQGTATLDDKGYHVEDADLQREIKGPVSATTSDSLTVLGQTVTVDALTEIVKETGKGTFANAVLADVTVGAIVEVYATPTATGLLATRIEIEDTETEAEKHEVGLRGNVSNLNTTDKLFDIKTYRVLYGSADVRGTLADQAIVEVEGTLEGTTVTANKVHVEDAEHEEHHEQNELVGVVSTLNLESKTFLLGDYTIDFSALTLPEGFSEGDRVEVKGTLDASNPKLIHATRLEVEFEKPETEIADHETTGLMSSLDVAGGSFKVGDLGFYVDGATIVDLGGTKGTLANLKDGLNVEVKYEDTKNGLGYFRVVRISLEEEHHGGSDD